MLNNYAATLANFKQFCEEYRIRYGMHLIGCEFFTGNKEVDGWVTSVYSTTLPVSVRGEKGYSRALREVSLYTEGGELLSYGDYMALYYPEYYHVWKSQIAKEDRIKYEHLEK